MEFFNKAKTSITETATDAGKVTTDKAVEIKDGAAGVAKTTTDAGNKQAGGISANVVSFKDQAVAGVGNATNAAGDNLVWAKDRAVEGFGNVTKAAGNAFEASKSAVTNTAGAAKDQTLETKKNITG